MKPIHFKSLNDEKKNGLGTPSSSVSSKSSCSEFYLLSVWSSFGQDAATFAASPSFGRRRRQIHAGKFAFF
jgi:hypothetical protein